MLKRFCALAVLFVAIGLPFGIAADTDPAGSLTKGSVTLKSAGPLAFGPAGILFVGDPEAAVIYAIDTGDKTASDSKDRPKIEGIDEKIAGLLGTEAKEIQIKDIAVNPTSGTTYLSVARGRGPGATPVLVSATRAGKLAEVSLKDVKFSKAAIPNAVEGKNRQEAITQIGYVNGRVILAGLSNEEFSSKLRAFPFPFESGNKGASVKIYHGAHGKFETKSPIRVFATYKISGEDHVLAGYQCTPLVKFPVAKLQPGESITGTTVAELGNRNRPLSMIVYNKDGKDYVLMANNARGLMKISLEGVDKIPGITSRISDTAGLKYDTIKGVTGVQKLDALGKEHAVVLLQSGGKMTLDTIALP